MCDVASEIVSNSIVSATSCLGWHRTLHQNFPFWPTVRESSPESRGFTTRRSRRREYNQYFTRLRTQDGFIQHKFKIGNITSWLHWTWRRSRVMYRFWRFRGTIFVSSCNVDCFNLTSCLRQRTKQERMRLSAMKRKSRIIRWAMALMLYHERIQRMHSCVQYG